MVNIGATAKIKLTTKKTDIEKKIRKALYNKLNKAAIISQIQALRFMKGAIRAQILLDPSYISLISHSREEDSLRAHFGLPDAVGRMDAIINAFINSFYITKIKGFFVTSNVGGSRNLKSGFTMVFKPKGGWERLTRLDASILTTKKGDNLPWLDWLLLKGDQRDLVVDYEIELGDFPRSRSRTGLAVMVGRKKGRSRGRWGGPLSHAGTTNKNCLTRSVELALKNNEKTLAHIIRTQFLRALK